jgi:hypothetical protein
MPRSRLVSACPARPVDRAIRGVVAVALALFAAAAGSTEMWLAVALGLGAATAAFGAITGRCPIDLLGHREQPAPNTLGLPEARQPIDVRLKE